MIEHPSALPRSALVDAVLQMQVTTESLRQQEALAVQEKLQVEAKLHASEAECAHLQNQLKMLREQLFGPKSERTKVEDPNQTFLALQVTDLPEGDDASQDTSDNEGETETAQNATEEDDDSEEITYRRKKSRAAAVAKPIPEIVTVLEGDESDRVGPNGERLVNLGYETIRKLHFTPASLCYIVIKRAKYGLPDTREYVATVPHEPCLVSGAKVTDALMLYIVLQKYGMGLPLYRQLQALRAMGADLADNYLGECVRYIAQAFAPIAHAIRDQVLISRWVHADETPMKQMKTGDKAERGRDIRTAYLWSWCGGKQIYFHYGLTRSQKEVRDCLGIPYDPDDPKRGWNADDDPGSWEHGSMIGFVVCDGYDGYNHIFRHSDLERVACWVHARRKFKQYEDLDTNAKQVVRAINQLFKLNKRIGRKAKDAYPNDLDRQYQWIAEQRQEQLGPLITALDELIDRLKPCYPPDTGLGPAITYLRNQWEALQTFLRHGFLPMDNNAAERGIRPIAVGRKAWLFVGSEDGGSWAATMFSIIESCRLQKINYTDYCEYVLQRIVEAPDRSKINYHELTPAQLQDTIKATYQQSDPA